MGKRASDQHPRPGRYVGIGQEHPGRRRNGTGKQRKLTPFLRKDQKGTAVEGFYRANFKKLKEQGNQPGALVQSQIYGGKTFHQEQARGGLSHAWDSGRTKGSKGEHVAKYMADNKVDRRDAKKHLIGLWEISFGADPKSR